jgi:hypothetical protein
VRALRASRCRDAEELRDLLPVLLEAPEHSAADYYGGRRDPAIVAHHLLAHLFARGHVVKHELDVVCEKELSRRGAIQSGGAVVEHGSSFPSRLAHDLLEEAHYPSRSGAFLASPTSMGKPASIQSSIPPA